MIQLNDYYLDNFLATLFEWLFFARYIMTIELEWYLIGNTKNKKFYGPFSNNHCIIIKSTGDNYKYDKITRIDSESLYELGYKAMEPTEEKNFKDIRGYIGGEKDKKACNKVINNNYRKIIKDIYENENFF